MVYYVNFRNENADFYYSIRCKNKAFDGDYSTVIKGQVYIRSTVYGKGDYEIKENSDTSMIMGLFGRLRGFNQSNLYGGAHGLLR